VNGADFPSEEGVDQNVDDFLPVAQRILLLQRQRDEGIVIAPDEAVGELANPALGAPGPFEDARECGHAA